MCRYYGRHYCGRQNEYNLPRYYGRKNGNNFRYYFIVPAEAFSWQPLYYHKLDEYRVETNMIIPDVDGLHENIHNSQAPLTIETVNTNFSSSPQKIIGQVVDAASKGTGIVSHKESIQSIVKYPVENNTIIPSIDYVHGNIPSYNIQTPVTGETVVRDFPSKPQKTKDQIMDAASKGAHILSHKVIVQSKESRMPRTPITHPEVMYQVVGFETLTVSNPKLAVGRLTVLKKKRFLYNQNPRH